MMKLIIACAAVGLMCSVAGAWVITEFAPYGHGTLGPYLELTRDGASPASIEMVVLNALPEIEGFFESQRVDISPDAGTSVIVVALSPATGWAAPLGAQLVEVDEMDLGGAAVAASRRVAVFDTSDGRTIGTSLLPPAFWDADATMPAREDMVTYSIAGARYGEGLGEPKIEMAAGQSAARWRSGVSFGDGFFVGAADEQGLLPGGGQLSPGLINTAVPEPASGALMLVAVGLGLLRGRRQI